MAIKYLYIDDSHEHVVEGQVSALNLNKSELEVIHRQPYGNWEAEHKYFTNDFSKEYDGLILDLRLDDEKNEKGVKAYYKGTSLAQELRTLSTEKAIKETPIVLLSANEKIIESLDTTGEDLFDIRIQKERLTGNIFIETRDRLIALGNAYKTISELKQKPQHSNWCFELLKVNEEDIDNRFVVKAEGLYGEPTHSLISFLIKSFLSSDGLLISERVIAARLGIDIVESEDWNKLLSLFDKGSYKGILCGGWKRWWSHRFEGICGQWFKDEEIRDLDAATRTEVLKRTTGLGRLESAAMMKYAQSSFYWTICRGSGRPIDPVDGLIIINQENLYPWQEKRYVSVEEALHRRNVQYWNEVATTEIDRLQRLQKLHSRERNK